jgi:ABC-2 type transport system ATP-binding protein
MIRVRSLSKVFRPPLGFTGLLRGRLYGPPVRALDAVALEVAAGEIVGLIGENGAGKSTLLRILAGLLTPTEGDVEIAGLNAGTAGPRLRREVALLAGEPRSFSLRLSGRANLELYAALHGYDRAAGRVRVDRALDRVGLSAADAARPVQGYSTGMRQRLSLARGLLGEPRVLLLDEPTAGLDPNAAAALRAFVRDELCARDHLTVLLASHDPGEVRELCQRVGLLKAGRLVGPLPADQALDTLRAQGAAYG